MKDQRLGLERVPRGDKLLTSAQIARQCFDSHFTGFAFLGLIEPEGFEGR